MNAFMVFSTYERARVVQEHPDISNTDLSKELGRRWNSLSAADRAPFVSEADRLRLMHMQEYPDYKYKPGKKRAKAGQRGNQNIDSPKPRSWSTTSAASWSSSTSRISISQGQRGILKSINPNRLQHRVTIDRKFKDALRKANSSLAKPSQGFHSLQPAREVSANRQDGIWTNPRVTHSVPTSPELTPTQPPTVSYDVPSNSCPNTPIAPPLSSRVHQPSSPWSSDTVSLPDLSELLSPTMIQTGDIHLDNVQLQFEPAAGLQLSCVDPQRGSTSQRLTTSHGQMQTDSNSCPEQLIQAAPLQQVQPEPSPLVQTVTNQPDSEASARIVNASSCQQTLTNETLLSGQPGGSEGNQLNTGDLQLDWTQDQLNQLNSINLSEALEFVDSWFNINNHIFNDIQL